MLPTTLVLEREAGHRTILPGEKTVARGAAIARGGSATADRRLGEAAWERIRQLMDDLVSRR